MKNLYIKTYGCQMNVYDSEMIGKIMHPIGFKLVEDMEKADLIVLNTCHIREKAAEKIYSELGKINVFTKKQDKKIITVVAGCVAQAEGEQMLKRAKNIDIVVGPQSIHTLPELVTKIERKNGAKVSLDFDPIKKFDFLKEERLKSSCQQQKKHSAFVSVQEGCDKFCTFCVVPYTRGAEYSRPVTEIYSEVLDLVQNGTQEITLLGQNVSGYHGNDSAGQKYNLGQLILNLMQINGIKRLRYTTSHPVDMHPELYLAHEKEERLMPFFHLPVQSGSDKILKKMNRKYTAKQYIEIIDKLRQSRPDIALSSDFIVGFPTETEDDFEQTLEVVEKVGYAQCFSFKYSPRPGTPGAEYKQIEESVKDKRLQKLQSLLKSQQLKFNQDTIGKTVSVFFDKKNDKQVVGKTPYMQSVYSEDFSLYGKIVDMKVTDAFQSTVKGDLVSG